MNSPRVILLALFAFVLLVLLIWIASVGDFGIMRMQPKMSVLAQGIGLFLAAAGGMGLLLGAATDAPPARLAAFLLPTLAGTLLIAPGWPATVGLGLAAAGLAVGPYFSRSRHDARDPGV